MTSPIFIFRHGHTNYGQGNSAIELAQARDLTPAGIADIIRSAECIAPHFAPADPVLICASPTGRTLHSARLIQDTLATHGVTKTEIRPLLAINEIRRFSPRLVVPLATGGAVEFEGQRFTVDASLTNPKGLKTDAYMTHDCLTRLPAATLAGFPPAYVEAISNAETFRDCATRFHRAMTRLCLIASGRRIIVVTHYAPSWFLAFYVSGGVSCGIEPGRFIQLTEQTLQDAITAFNLHHASDTH